MRSSGSMSTPSTSTAARTGDLMTYCYPKWTSDYTWTRIANRLQSRSGTTSSSGIPLANPPSLLVSGIITPSTQQGTLDPFYVLPVAPIATTTPTGTYQIRYEAASGQVLASYPFDPELPIDPEAGTAAGPIGFTLLLPWNPDAAVVRLVRSGAPPNDRSAPGTPRAGRRRSPCRRRTAARR